MPRSRFSNLEPDKQETILAAAAAEFGERGYEAASLNRVIEGAGISKGALYYYFEDKADLFATTLETAVERVLEAVGWVEPDRYGAEDYWERWRELTQRSFEVMRSGPWYMRVILAFPRFQAEPAAASAMSRLRDQMGALTRRLLERGQQLGVVRTDLPLDMLVELVQAVGEAGGRWITRRWDSLNDDERRALLEARLDLTRDMLDSNHMGWGQ